MNRFARRAILVACLAIVASASSQMIELRLEEKVPESRVEHQDENTPAPDEAAPPSTRTRRRSVSEQPEQYRRFIKVMATDEDWTRVAVALGVERDAPAVEEVARWYRVEFDRLAMEFGQWATERRVVTALTSVQTHMETGATKEEAECRETLQSCVRKLRSSALPAADAAIEQGFERLALTVPNASAELIARARRGLFLAARQRSLERGGELGLNPRASLPEIVANAPPDACNTEGSESPLGTDQRATAIAQIVLDWEIQVEALVVQAIRLNETAMLKVFSAEGNAHNATVAKERQSLRTQVELPIRRATDNAIDRIADVIGESCGIEARAAWEDFAWSATLGVFHSPERPTHAWAWISRRGAEGVIAPEVVDRCRDFHRAYLADRAPLRFAMRAALLSCTPKDLTSQFDDKTVPGALNAAMKSRHDLSTSCLRLMLDALPEIERSSLNRHLELVEKQRGNPYGHMDDV